MQFDGRFRPDAPVPKQPALDAHAHCFRTSLDVEWHCKVEHDVVVVAGVERHAILRPRGNHTANHVQRPVAVERRHLDRDHVRDFREALPELHRQGDAADRRLQVEPDQRHYAGHGGAMLDEFVDRRAFHRREAQHCGVVAEAKGGLCLLLRLRSPAGQARHQDQRLARRPVPRRVRGKLLHRLIQPGFADCELRGMHPDRQPAGPRVDVVAGERPLPARVKLARSIQRQRMGGNHRAVPEGGQDGGGKVGPEERHGVEL